jgi:hypothetical protein
MCALRASMLRATSLCMVRGGVIDKIGSLLYSGLRMVVVGVVRRCMCWGRGYVHYIAACVYVYGPLFGWRTNFSV